MYKMDLIRFHQAGRVHSVYISCLGLLDPFLLVALVADCIEFSLCSS
jgi:hypothetical protein